jgi:hypothetical protein
MGNLTTAVVGTTPSVIYGSPGSSQGITVLNLDTSGTVWLGYSASMAAATGGGGIPVGPLASMQFDGTQSVYAVAAGQLTIGIAPGVTSYTAGSLTISGPVTADITGPVEVEGSIGITGTPAVTIDSGSVAATITGTTDVNVQNGTIDVIGSGGYILPGTVASALSVNSVSAPAGGSGGGWWTSSTFDVSGYNSLDVVFTNVVGSSDATGAAICACVEFEFQEPNGQIAGYQVGWVIVGRGGSGITSVFSVPCAGSKCTLNVINFGTAASINISSVNVMGSYRQLQGKWVFTDGIGSPSGTYGGAAYAPAGMAYYWAQGSAARLAATLAKGSGLSVFIVGQWHGEVSGWFQEATTLLGNDPVIIDLAFQTVGNLAAGTNANTVVNFANNITAPATQLVTYNASPSVYALVCNQNSSTGATTINLALTGI